MFTDDQVRKLSSRSIFAMSEDEILSLASNNQLHLLTEDQFGDCNRRLRDLRSTSRIAKEIKNFQTTYKVIDLP